MPTRLFPVQPQTQGGQLLVPTAPGLGVEVDEAALARASFRFWEAPHLRRPDGSVTNW